MITGLHVWDHKVQVRTESRSSDSLQVCSACATGFIQRWNLPGECGEQQRAEALGGGQGLLVQTVAFQPSNEQRAQQA